MARGKYAHVIDKLPRLLGTEPAYQDKVEAVKAAIAAEPGFKRYASVLVRMYENVRAEKDAVEAALSEINLRLEAVSQMMTDQFENEGIASMKTDSGRSVSFFLEPYARVEDAAAFQEWCMRSPDLRRKLALPWMTTNALTKELLLAGQPEPPGVTIYSKTKIRLGPE